MAQETYDWSVHYFDEQNAGTTTFNSASGETVDITVSQPDPGFDYVSGGDGFETGQLGGSFGGYMEMFSNFFTRDDTLTTTISFANNTESGDNSVTNVSFTIFDIDSTVTGSFQDQVTVVAYDVNGLPLPVVMTAVNPGDVLVTGNTATAILGAGTGPSGSAANNSTDGNVVVNIAGEVASIEITYGNGPDAQFFPAQQTIGISDLTFDLVPLIICFVRGTEIRTDRGDLPVEALLPGDLVMTVDHGLQPIRWIGSRRVRARGAMAPVRFAPGSLGNDKPLVVSPQHRVVLGGWKAELYAGADEVLVPAISLVNDHDITRQTGGEVEYFHLMFDQHEIIYAEGVATESLLVTKRSIASLPTAARQEFEALFPELYLRPETTGEAARPILKTYEASVLAAA